MSGRLVVDWGVMDGLGMGGLVMSGLVMDGLVMHNSLVVNDGDDVVNDSLVMRGRLVMDGSVVVDWGLVMALVTVVVSVGTFVMGDFVMDVRSLVVGSVVWLVAHLVGLLVMDWLLGV